MVTPYLAIPATAAAVAVLVPALLRRSFRVRRLPEQGSPADRGLPYREMRIPTANGKTLFAWYLPPQGPVPAPAVAILHGWSGNAETMLPLAAPLYQAGFAVLLFDARCHGRSDGDEFASLPRFAEDLDHALDWLAAQPEVDRHRLVALGHSLGASAALLSAARRRDLAAVVSLAAFAHPETMIRRWLACRGIPYVPVGWWLARQVEWAIGHRHDDIAPVNTIKQVRCPVLLMHGAGDVIVQPEDAEIIHAARATDCVELRVLDGIGHSTIDQIHLVNREVLEFLVRHGIAGTVSCH